MRGNVMEGYDPALPHERRVHLKVLAHAVVGVIPVNEQKIKRAASEETLHTVKSFARMGISAKQAYALPLPAEGFVKGNQKSWISTSVVSARHIQANDRGILRHVARKQKQRAAHPGSYLHSRFGISRPEDIEQCGDFRTHLTGTDGARKREVQGILPGNPRQFNPALQVAA